MSLVCDVDTRGRTRLRHESFCAPIHLSKPHWEENTLVLNIVNPTAGFLEGDRLEVDVLVEQGARLLLTSPGANRVHTMSLGGGAEVRQRLRVAAGASLEMWPELLIPQRGARYWQRTDIELAAGAELLFFERLAPGRTAMGEVFEFAEVRLDTDVRVDGRLLLRERSRLEPGSRALEALRRRFGQAYYACGIMVSPDLAPDAACWQRLHDLHDDRAWIGVSMLGAPGDQAYVLKVVAADSLALRRVWDVARAAIYASLGRQMPGLRRT